MLKTEIEIQTLKLKRKKKRLHGLYGLFLWNSISITHMDSQTNGSLSPVREKLNILTKGL